MYRRMFAVSALLLLSLKAIADSPQCAAVICLTPGLGKAPPNECFAYREPYFSIRIFDHMGFDARATAKARDLWISKCIHIYLDDRIRIRTIYGYLFDDPRTY